MLIQMSPSEFFDALQLFKFIMINHQVQYSSWLKQTGFSSSFSCGCSYPIYQVGLYPKQFSENLDNNTGLSILNCTKNKALCFIQLIRHNYLLIKTILAAVFSVRSSLLTSTK